MSVCECECVYVCLSVCVCVLECVCVCVNNKCAQVLVNIKRPQVTTHKVQLIEQLCTRRVVSCNAIMSQLLPMVNQIT